MTEKPTTVRATLSKAWPGLRYLSLGVWAAWLFLISSGSIWLSDTEFDGTYVAYLMLGMSIIGALVCLAAPAAKARFEAFLSNRQFIIGSSFVATLGAVSIILAGPFYLGSVFLFWFGVVLVSLFSGLFVLKCGSLYGALDSRRVLLFSLYSEIVVVGLSYFTVGNDFFVPVIGGPSLAGILAFALLPPITAWLVCLPASKSGKSADRAQENKEVDLLRKDAMTPQGGAAEAAGEEDMRGQQLEQSNKPRFNIIGLPNGFWKFLFMIFFFTIASEMFRYYFVAVQVPTITYIDSKLLLLLRLAFALIVLYYALRTRREIRFSKMYQFSLVALAVIVALIPLLQNFSTFLGGLLGLISVCMNLLIWCLLSMVVYEKKMPFIVVFGYGQGVLLIARAFGWALGIGVLPAFAGSSWEPFIYWGMAVLILVATVLFFSEMHLEKMFENIAKVNVSLDLSQTQNEFERQHRPWREACKKIAERSSLSKREQEVFELIATGRSPQNVAKHLVVSIHTVRSHIRNIYVKLDAHSHEELVSIVEKEIESIE